MREAGGVVGSPDNREAYQVYRDGEKSDALEPFYPDLEWVSCEFWDGDDAR